MDQRSLLVLNTLHPRFRTTAITAWDKAQKAMPENIQIVAIEGLRSFLRSDQLYAIGRTVTGDNPKPEQPMGEIVTKAKAGQSYHNYGLAFDFQILTNGKADSTVGPNWRQIVAILKDFGIDWGGNFPEGFHDDDHFEKRFGYSWHDLLAKYEARDFVAGTEYVKL